MNTKGKLKYLTIPSFDNTNTVRHCFTSRCGGVSIGECSSLNLGFKRKDSHENVIINTKIISEVLHIDYRDYVYSDQIHDTRIKHVCEEDKGKGIMKKSDIIGVDGLITDRLHVPLITFYADCVPLFFLDARNKVIALSHAGWKGTVKHIGTKTIGKMKEKFGTNPRDCLVGIGPSIGPCCFEVDEPVALQFRSGFKQWDKLIQKKDRGKYIIDLWEANRLQLVEQGVEDSNITLAGICTKCNRDLFFSHRRDKGNTGSMAAIIQLV